MKDAIFKQKQEIHEILDKTKGKENVDIGLKILM